jgi:isopentenyl-diphosphate delta-isomerase
MEPLCQLYSAQGSALVGQGATRDEVFSKGLLHGAAHVWIWRSNNKQLEVLLQKRASVKRTWPNFFDISAAGHIDLGEDSLIAAVREAKEEIDLDIHPADLQLAGVYRAHLIAQNGNIENEFQWLYLLELSQDLNFKLQADEVESLEWKPLQKFKDDIHQSNNQYVPHGNLYFDTVITAIEAVAKPRT